MSNIRGFHNIDMADRPATTGASGYRMQSGSSFQPASASGRVPASGPVSAVSSSRAGPGGSVVYGPDSGPTVSLLTSPPSPDDPRGDSIFYRIFPRFSVRSLTFAISMVQVAMFVVSLIVGGTRCDGAFVRGNSMLGPGPVTFYLLGGKYEPDIRRGHIWRLLTPALLHGGFIHILSNLFFQFRYGFSLETRWGMARFGAVYAVSTLGASFFSCICAPDTIGVGASGALFGLTGADLTYLGLNWAEIPDNRQELCMMLCLIGINLLLGISGSVDNYAHLGGLITGLVVAGWILVHATQRPETTERAIKLGAVVATVAWFLINICVLWVGNPSPDLNAWDGEPTC